MMVNLFSYALDTVLVAFGGKDQEMRLHFIIYYLVCHKGAVEAHEFDSTKLSRYDEHLLI